MAQVFSLAHPYGQKRIMSSFAFDAIAQGPPSDENGNILAPSFDDTGNCTNGWVCEHRWHAISSMVGFMNTCEGENITSWWDNGKNQIAFSRGSKGFIVFNLDSEDMKNVTIETTLNPGIYCDVISGDRVSDNSCSGKMVAVAQDGKISVDLAVNDPNGVIAIYSGKRIFEDI